MLLLTGLGRVTGFTVNHCLQRRARIGTPADAEVHMRTVRRILVTASCAGLLTFGLAPAANASGYAPMPPDCTLAPAGTDGQMLTCTARPATQTWNVVILCWYWTKPSRVPGTEVTGNGTSEAHCLNGIQPEGPAYFYIDS